MSQAVILDLDLAVTEVGILGDEPEELELSDEIKAKLMAEVQAQVQQFQQQMELQQAQLTQTGQALSKAIEQIKQIQTQAIAEMQGQAVELALTIARKVIAQEIQAERVEIDPIITDALQQLPARGEITIHLNPDDLKNSGFAKEAQEINTRDLKFVSDPEIAKGGCRVESVEGSVESSIESSFQTIGQTLRAAEGE